MYRSTAQSPTSREVAKVLRAGEVLFYEGDPCEHVFELQSGVARGISISVDGERQLTAFFFAGDQIGLPIAECYRFTVEAVTDLAYVRHSRLCWHEAFISSCREEGRLLPSICAEQDPIFRRGLILGRGGILMRVCAFLVSIIDRLPADAETLVFPITQADIADYVASTTETVCRSIGQLREMRIIAMPRRDRLIVRDRDRLAMIASGAFGKIPSQRRTFSHDDPGSTLPNTLFGASAVFLPSVGRL